MTSPAANSAQCLGCISGLYTILNANKGSTVTIQIAFQHQKLPGRYMHSFRQGTHTPHTPCC